MITLCSIIKRWNSWQRCTYSGHWHHRCDMILLVRSNSTVYYVRSHTDRNPSPVEFRWSRKSTWSGCGQHQVTNKHTIGKYLQKYGRAERVRPKAKSERNQEKKKLKRREFISEKGELVPPRETRRERTAAGLKEPTSAGPSPDWLGSQPPCDDIMFL